MNKKIILNIIFLSLGLSMLLACGKKEDELILGKWQNEQDWFEYKKDQKYSAGKMMLTMVKDFKYTIDTKAKQLTMYTDEANQTYYLIYRFYGEDTLAVRNQMNTDTSKMVKFYRVSK